MPQGPVYSDIEEPKKIEPLEYIPGVSQPKTKTLVNEKEIELLKVQIDEIKVLTSNPLAN